MYNSVTGGALCAERRLESFNAMRVGRVNFRWNRSAGRYSASQVSSDSTARGRVITDIADPFLKALAQHVEVAFMALQAEEWLILNQHVVCHRTMWVVTDGAVIFYRCMAKNEWTLVTAVTVKTEVVGALDGVQLAVRVVTVAAIHLAFLDRMVGREVGFCLLLLVARIAELWILLLESHFAAGMNRVTVGATHIGEGVLAVRPVHQFAVSVTLGANRCGFFRQQLAKLKNLIAVRVDMQAAAAMAGFAPFSAAHVLKSGQARVNTCAHTFVTLRAGLLTYGSCALNNW